MATNEDREAVGASLRSWGKRRNALDAERDPLVRRALGMKISKEEIHQSTGLGRSTIDRIEKTKVSP